MKRRVTIQGVAGCYHDAAARLYFAGEDIETVPCDTFNDMFDVLSSDASMYGILAIENTIAGSLLQNHELLRQSNLRVIGEQKMRITHMLAALPGQSIDELTEVNSHPIALMQCENYLRRHPNLKMIEKFDTAGSAREIAENNLVGHAAVCGEYAAQLYGLNILVVLKPTSAISHVFSSLPTRCKPTRPLVKTPLTRPHWCSLCRTPMAHYRKC